MPRGLHFSGPHESGRGTSAAALRLPRMNASRHSMLAKARSGPFAAPMRASPRGTAAFDRWLSGELARLYDDALEEPVPEELLQLLAEPAAKP